MKFAYGKEIKVEMNILDCITSEEDRKVAKENYDFALKGESYSNAIKFTKPGGEIRVFAKNL